MIYKFDKHNLEFVKDKKRIGILGGSLLLVVVGSFILGRYVQSTILDNFEVKILSYEKEENRFTEQKLVDMLVVENYSLKEEIEKLKINRVDIPDFEYHNREYKSIE